MIIKRMKHNIIVKIAIAMTIFTIVFVGLYQLIAYGATRTLTLTLNGDDEIHLWIGTEYQELGATAYDSVQGDLSSEIIIDSTSINKDVEGLYEVSYSVTNSALSTETKIRKVIVQDYSFQKESRFIKTSTTLNSFSTVGSNLNFSDSINSINKMIELRNGGFLAVGTMMGSTALASVRVSYIAKYDQDFNIIWQKQISPVSANNHSYCYDVIEDYKGNYILDINYNNNYTHIYILDQTGKVLNNASCQYPVINLEQINNNDYLLLGSGHSYYYKFSINYINDQPEISPIVQYTATGGLYAGTPTYNYDKGILYNNRIYCVGSNETSYLRYYDLNSNTFVNSTISIKYGKFEIVNDKIYYFNEDNYMGCMDLDFNIISEKHISEKCFEAGFYVSEYYIIMLDNSNGSTLYYYSVDTFELLFSNDIDNNMTKCSGILFTSTGDTYIYGTLLDTYYYAFIVKLNPYVWFTFDEPGFFVKTSNDYMGTINVSAALLQSITIDDIDLKNIDYNKAGNYEIYYYLRLLIGNNYQSWIRRRNVEIQPKTSIENGKSYDKYKTIDIEGGDIKINGSSYENGDKYNIPGTATIMVYGKDDYTKTYSIYINLSVDGLVDGEEYIESVSPIISGGTCNLNGEPYEIGTKIEGPGDYQLIINGVGTQAYYNFRINPYLNVEDGGEYNYSIIPAISSASMTLDDTNYTSNTLVTTAGEHVLKIFGLNGYYKKLTFTIVAGANVEDGASYDLSKEIYFVGDSAKLNGVEISNGYNIDKIGNYNLVISNGSDVFEYNFTINPIVNGITEGTEYTEHVKIDIKGTFVSALINNVISTELNDSKSIDLNIVGNNILTIKGVNGYSKDYHFIVNPNVTGFEEGKSYFGSVSYTIDGIYQKLYLNDEEVTTITDVTNAGLNKLKVVGANNYEKIFTFRIVKDVPNIENDGIYDGLIIPVLYDQTLIYKLNGKNYEINTPINTVGNNILTISDGADYYRELHFVIRDIFNNKPETALYTFAPSFSGEAKYYLNGALLPDINSQTIDTVGNNRIHVVGINGYTNDYVVVIEESISGVQNGDKTQSFNIKNNSNCELYIDELLIGNDINYKKIGNHTLTVKGINNYSKSYNFTVIADFDIDSQYDEVFVPLEYEDCNVKIDGINYNSGESFVKIGNHILTVYGAGSYAKNYAFTIVPKIYGKNLTNTYDELVCFEILDNSAVIKIDNISYTSNSDYNVIGNHKLSIVGSNDYLYEYEFTIKEKVISFENNGRYVNSLVINVENCFNKITLDGTEIDNGYNCNVIGTHEIKIYGTNNYVNNYSVFVYPSVEGVNDGKSYTSTVSWSIGGKGSCYLDGKNVTMNSSTSTVGKHILEIKSNSGYFQKIEFYILPEIIGVIDGSEYTSSVTFTINNCELYLNGNKLIDNSYTVTTVGNHTLVIKGTNDYLKQIQFTVKEKSLGFDNGASYDSLVLIGLESTTSYLDGSKISTNTRVTQPGLHKLQVTGVGGYSKNYQFTINANPSFEGNVINCSDCDMKLNGNAVVNNTQINQIGKNEIIITGTNGYEKSYYVDVASNCEISNNTVYENRVLIKKLNARMFIDGDEIFEDTYIEEDGNHELVILGVGGYEEVVNFKVQNNNITYSIIVTSVVLVFITFFTVLIIRRRRVI